MKAIYLEFHPYCVITIGLNFWKIGSRKFFAVRESSLASQSSGPSPKGKRKYKATQIVDDPDSTSDEEVPRPKCTKTCTAIVKELEELKDQIKNIVEVKASCTKVPIGLLTTIRSTFRCALCLSLINPPYAVVRTFSAAKNVQLSFFQKDWLSAGMGRKCPMCRVVEGDTIEIIIDTSDTYLVYRVVSVLISNNQVDSTPKDTPLKLTFS